MKTICRLLVVAILLVSVNAFAGTFDGVYKFEGRSKNGTVDMKDAWGMMIITDNTVSRVFHTPKGDKYYVGAMTQDGENWKVKFKYVYKPEYVGNEHTNKITVESGKLTFASPDGTFKETWVKQ